MVAFVVLWLVLCPLENGQPSEFCDDLVVRAKTCVEAAAWARGWIPPGFVVVSAECREERVAGR